MSFLDRILTIVITATLTSAVWIVAGGSLIQLASDREGEESIRPAEAIPSPTASIAPDEGDGANANASDNDSTNASDNTNASSSEDTPSAPSLDTPANQPSPTPSVEPAERALMIPVKNVRASDLTDTFTVLRDGNDRAHEAIDIIAPEGTSVVAAAPGTIEKLFSSDAAGNSIYVRSADRRTIHFYSHLREFAVGLREGQRIRRGQRLGTVGSTGNANSESPHLHFAMLRTTADAAWWEPANAVNPYPLLLRGTGN